MIKLEDYVSETIKQIVSGIVAAQKAGAELGAEVNPSTARFRTDQGMQLFDKRDSSLIEKVEFNVAVTSVEGMETKGGVGIFVGPVGIGGQGQANTTNQSTSTIRFSVPIKFPTQ